MYDWLIAQIGVDTVRVGGVAVAFLVAALVIWLIIILSRRIRGQSVRGEQKSRLAMSASMAVDAQRRLVIVRRDGVEHLLLIGGPSDLVIESKIPTAPLGSGVHGVLENRHDGLVRAVVDEDAAIDFVQDKKVPDRGLEGGAIATSAIMPRPEVARDTIAREELLREAALREAVQRGDISREHVQAEEVEEVEAAPLTVDEQPAPVLVTRSEERVDVLPHEIETRGAGLDEASKLDGTIGDVALQSMDSQTTLQEQVMQGGGSQENRKVEDIRQAAASIPIDTSLFAASIEQEEPATTVEEEPPFASYFAGQPKNVPISPEARRVRPANMVSPSTSSTPSAQSPNLRVVPMQGFVPAPSPVMPTAAAPMSSPIVPKVAAVQQAGDVREREQPQGLSLNPFVRLPVAHSRAAVQKPSEPPLPPYSNSFLGYPVQRFSDSSFPPVGTTLAAEPALEAEAATAFQPVGFSPSPVPFHSPDDAAEQGATQGGGEPIAEQNLVEDFEQMLHDELMQPIDSGLKVVSFKP